MKILIADLRHQIQCPCLKIQFTQIVVSSQAYLCYGFRHSQFFHFMWNCQVAGLIFIGQNPFFCSRIITVSGAYQISLVYIQSAFCVLNVQNRIRNFKVICIQPGTCINNNCLYVFRNTHLAVLTFISSNIIRFLCLVRKSCESLKITEVHVLVAHLIVIRHPLMDKFGSISGIQWNFVCRFQNVTTFCDFIKPRHQFPVFFPSRKQAGELITGYNIVLITEKVENFSQFRMLFCIQNIIFKNHLFFFINPISENKDTVSLWNVRNQFLFPVGIFG